MDFANAQLPEMTPLANSYAADEVEAELKQLTTDLFASLLASDTFDVSVAGAAQLGSIALVGRAIAADGLAFPIDGGSTSYAARHLFKAWKGQNGQGRGLHFLRTYLALLFPGAGVVRQLWQKKGVPYPTDLSHQESADRWLTSRIEIWIDAQGADPALVLKVVSSIRAVIPARFVPTISVVTNITASAKLGGVITATKAMNMTASVS